MEQNKKVGTHTKNAATRLIRTNDPEVTLVLILAFWLCFFALSTPIKKIIPINALGSSKKKNTK